jgi:AcrR family transcriptional regulator
MNAQATRQHILDAAQRLIETEGFAGLTTKQIAREAGCAEGTLFKHFARKEDLCLAVVLENSPRFRDAIAEKRAGKGSVANNLCDIVLAALQFSDKLIPLAVSLFADTSLLARHRQVMQQTGRGPRDVFDLVAAYIAAEQELGRIGHDVEALTAACLLLGPCFHWAFLRQATGKSLYPMKDQEFATSLVAALIQGLRPKPRGALPLH